MHEDLKTALDESRVNESRWVYKYSENDLDETKVLDNELSSLKQKEEKERMKQEQEVEEEIKVENKKQNKLLITLISIFTGLVLVSTVVISLYFKKSEVKNVTIPDVSKYTVVEASNKLTDLGFSVSDEYKYIASEEVDAGLVVKTSPEIGRKIKSGSTIILYLSSGDETYVMEDYVGENYLVAKGKIEVKCQCNVLVETQKVDEEDKEKEETVLKTVPSSGESIKLGESITIYIPEIEYKYPNFTSGYTIATLEEFVKKHELKLEYKYQESASLAEGTIIKQSRAKGTVVTPGATLVITVSVLPETAEDVTDETDDVTSINSGE